VNAPDEERRHGRRTPDSKRIAGLLGLLTIAVALVLTYPVVRHPFLLAALWREHPAATLPVPVIGVKRAQLTDS
jgi:hypothetical protein